MLLQETLEAAIDDEISGSAIDEDDRKSMLLSLSDQIDPHEIWSNQLENWRKVFWEPDHARPDKIAEDVTKLWNQPSNADNDHLVANVSEHTLQVNYKCSAF